MNNKDLGRVADGDQALVNEAPAGLRPPGFDPSRVEVLSLGNSDVKCSGQRWVEIFTEYSPQARYHAANLGAHNWDVLHIGGRIFLISWYGDNGHWLPKDFGRQNPHLSPALPEETAALYDTNKHPKVRLFASGIEARSDETRDAVQPERQEPGGVAETPAISGGTHAK